MPTVSSGYNNYKAAPALPGVIEWFVLTGTMIFKRKLRTSVNLLFLKLEFDRTNAVRMNVLLGSRFSFHIFDDGITKSVIYCTYHTSTASPQFV